jgi:hypothetical protein
MRKLSLDLDAIQVESFSTQSAAAARGTVDARQGRETWTCPVPTQDTCAGTCEYSCNGTCGGGGTTGSTCVSCAQTCDLTCNTCAATCDSCMATCNFATGPQRCCA